MCYINPLIEFIMKIINDIKEHLIFKRKMKKLKKDEEVDSYKYPLY